MYPLLNIYLKIFPVHSFSQILCCILFATGLHHIVYPNPHPSTSGVLGYRKAALYRVHFPKLKYFLNYNILPASFLM